MLQNSIPFIYDLAIPEKRAKVSPFPLGRSVGKKKFRITAGTKDSAWKYAPAKFPPPKDKTVSLPQIQLELSVVLPVKEAVPLLPGKALLEFFCHIFADLIARLTYGRPPQPGYPPV